MNDLKFIERMKNLLGEEYDSFAASLQDIAVRGVRINTLKATRASLSDTFLSKLSPISYEKNGYIANIENVGHTPEHHSGMIYVQDPGAMSALASVDIGCNWKILDLCSAPGGKSSQAAASAACGSIIANEYVPKRAKITVGNFERLGIKNATVTSLDTGEFPKMFSNYFDLVIADVPCSGEGMFRKSREAVEEWSEENVLLCAKRGREILENASAVVKPGGYLIYSTCTYSLEENEKVVDDFISSHSEYSIKEVKEHLKNATRDGIIFPGAKNTNLNLCRRFYPHVSSGEGQFVALLQKEMSDAKEKVLYNDSTRPPSRDELSAAEKFFKENLTSRPKGRIAKCGENLVLISHGIPIMPKSVFSAGVLIGKVEKGLLFPSHQFFSCYGNLFVRQENLLSGDSRCEKYLAGEQIEAKDVQTSGWCAVLYNSVALGGGKMSSGVIKNHYPKGLRNKL